MTDAYHGVSFGVDLCLRRAAADSSFGAYSIVELFGTGATSGREHIIDDRPQAFFAEKAYVMLGRPKIVGAIIALSL